MYKQATDHTAEDYSSVMAINFEPVFHLCQLAHPLLKAMGTGSIINISSVCGTIAQDGSVLYSAIKVINQEKLHTLWMRIFVISSDKEIFFSDSIFL